MTQAATSAAPRERQFPIFSFVILAVGAWYTFAKPAPADPIVDAGRDAVELHFINHSGWNGPVRCRAGTYQSYPTVFCHPSGGPRIGGLFIVGVEAGRPVIYPINGKAMTYTKGFDSIEAMDSSRLPLRSWPGNLIDIPKAIEGATSRW